MNNCRQNDVIYRRMKTDDIDSVVAVEKRSFSVPWSEKMFLEELDNPNTVYYVAEINKNIVAYCGMWIITGEAHITNIAVDPLYRGRRIGSGLMRRIMEVAREKKLTGITLEVREGNTSAISMYKRFGFRVEGRRKGYYSDNQEDALIMWFYPD